MFYNKFKHILKCLRRYSILHLVKYIGLVCNSIWHLSISGTFAVLQVPRLRAAFPVFPGGHAPSTEEDLQGAVWVPAHGLKTQQGWEVWPSWSRWFVTWISKHLFEFYRYFRSVVLGHYCYLKFIFTLIHF